jgi:hypothetical protein
MTGVTLKYSESWSKSAGFSGASLAPDATRAALHGCILVGFGRFRLCAGIDHEGEVGIHSVHGTYRRVVGWDACTAQLRMNYEEEYDHSNDLIKAKPAGIFL